MYCRHCGKEVEDGAVFCSFCGGRLRNGAPPAGGRLYAHGLTRLKIPGETKNPGVAAAIGFFLQWMFFGAFGYGYLGQWNWFWLAMAGQFLAILFTFGTAYILLPILFAVHQYQMAKDLNLMVVEERSGIEGGAPAREARLSVEE